MPDIDEKTKQEIIKKYSKEYTKRGREILGSGPGIFGYKRKSYTELIKELFPVEPLPQGAIPIFDKDINKCEKCGMVLPFIADIITGYEHTEEECLIYLIHES